MRCGSAHHHWRRLCGIEEAQTILFNLKYKNYNVIRNKITEIIMLKRFAVENYRGFRDRVEMDLSKVRLC